MNDLAIYFALRSINAVQSQFCLTIKRVSAWGIENGLNVSAYKTVCVHLCKRRVYLGYATLNGTILPFAEFGKARAKFFGLVFNRKLSWQLAELKRNCNMFLK